jgi:hypothetical protein
LAHGDIVDGRVFQLETPNDAISDLWISTGGSDGAWQSFNDRRECIVRLEFADGASGLYLLRPRADGDATGDGVVGLDDFAGFEECRQFNATENLDCRAFDIDLDGDIDLTDFGYLQLLWSSS